MGTTKVMQVEVWREVCRHIEIAGAIDLIFPILARNLPIAGVMVRRIDVGRSVLETAGANGLCAGENWGQPRTECLSTEIERLLSWCRRGDVFRGSGEELRAMVQGAIPSGATGLLLVGPLSGTDGPIGVLVLLAKENDRFDSEHESITRALLEPFSVALENDARLRELNALREAAEADKRTLLNRLGRSDLSDTIVGADGGLRHVMERANLVAGSDAPVLIFGETGSGKEVVARAIHARSRRVQSPFLRVNCGAIPPDLIDSELFGHERGSFTGALNLRKGWFERADGGTLFLDEIGELPPAAQVRLLRILQDGTFERVGGQRQLTVDVRIVAATHRNLQAMVADKLFREDLWYRLAVFPIHLPALREHVEDIPELASHFALKASRRFGTMPLTPTPGDLHLLISYSWPGNVRELQSVLERAVILGNGHRLDVATALGVTTTSPVTTATSLTPASKSEPGKIPSLDAAMKQHIESALTQTHGRVEGRQGAASLLGINPHTLRARMRKLKIDWKRFRAVE